MADILDFFKNFFVLLINFLENMKTGGLFDLSDMTGLFSGLLNK